MKKYKAVFSMIAALIVCLSVLSPITAHADSQEKLKIEAVGFFTHFPMQETKQAIESTCAEFDGQIELTLYDETKPEGIAFMEEMGLSGHIPMRLYINGENTFDLNGKEVSFRDFVGYEWTVDDLELAISISLGAADDVAEIENGNESENGNGIASEKDKDNNVNSLFIVAAVVLVLAVGGIVFIQLKGKKSAKAKVKK